MRPFHCLTSMSFVLLCTACAANPGDDVGSRTIESVTFAGCASRPAVVFENGARETFATWDKVIASIRKDATVFAYNRPGYGKSSVTDSPRDGRTVVDELRATLRRQGLQPPYILVGHSLGGLYMQLFARAYPGEVQGLVLVDSIWPGAVKKPEDFPLYTRIAKRVFFSRTVNGEIDHIHDTGSQVVALPWTTRIPVERLINVPKSRGAIGVDFGVFNSGPRLMAMIDGLYPDAHTLVVDSDHRIQVATPDAVVAAIRRVMPTAPTPGADGCAG
jgi:pimeloyl-ACP methyl ester carboxylesterase